MNDYSLDIPYEVAKAAHNGTSFVPEKRASSVIADYAATLSSDRRLFEEAAAKHGTSAIVEEQFSRYREGYRKRTLAYLHSRSRLVSVMIAGGSKFPAARMNKRADVSGKRLNELVEFRRKAHAAIMKHLCPHAGPIMSGDPDAVERLERDIREAERLQAAMKQANAIIREKPKNQTTIDKLARMADLGITPSRATRLFEPDFCGRIGFPDYALSNNSANIRRMKARLEQVTAAKATPDSTVESDSVTITDSPADNRIRLFFPGKPSDSVRSTLKASGFRWTPTLGCWQAYRNHKTIAIAKSFMQGVQG